MMTGSIFRVGMVLLFLVTVQAARAVDLKQKIDQVLESSDCAELKDKRWIKFLQTTNPGHAPALRINFSEIYLSDSEGGIPSLVFKIGDFLRAMIPSKNRVAGLITDPNYRGYIRGWNCGDKNEVKNCLDILEGDLKDWLQSSQVHFWSYDDYNQSKSEETFRCAENYRQAYYEFLKSTQ